MPLYLSLHMLSYFLALLKIDTLPYNLDLMNALLRMNWVTTISTAPSSQSSCARSPARWAAWAACQVGAGLSLMRRTSIVDLFSHSVLLSECLKGSRHVCRTWLLLQRASERLNYFILIKLTGSMGNGYYDTFFLSRTLAQPLCAVMPLSFHLV